MLRQSTAGLRAKARIAKEARHRPISWNRWQQLVAESGRRLGLGEKREGARVGTRLASTLRVSGGQLWASSVQGR